MTYSLLLEDVCKYYRGSREYHGSLREDLVQGLGRMVGRRPNRRRVVRALDHVDLEVPEGGTILSDRRSTRPYPLSGGQPASPGLNQKYTASNTNPVPLPGKSRFTLNPGDILQIQTPGGAGWGNLAQHADTETQRKP